MCPICGRTFLIPLGVGRGMLEDKFLHHKDACTIARRWEYVAVRGYATRVTRVDLETEGFPIIEVVFPSGRRGAYRAAVVRRYPDQDAGERVFRRAKRRER